MRQQCSSANKGDILNNNPSAGFNFVPFYEDGTFLINGVIILICPVWLCDAPLTCNESRLI